ncbi:MAG: N-acetylmuramoyl-L-alanine amidase-like domain-containing protein [Bacteroidota bacterium]
MKKYKFLFIFLLSGLILPACFLAGNGQQQEESADSITSVHYEFDILITAKDSLFFEEFVSSIDIEKIKKQELSDIITQVALYFDGAPYVAHTLEICDVESLVVNLREFDCTTFAENVLALTLMMKNGDPSLSVFIENLKMLRYRDNFLSGYPSRLHYFTDWLYNNEQKGIVDIVSNDFGNRNFRAYVNYMTQNFEKYPALSRDSSFVKEMSVIEEEVSGYDFKLVTGDYISAITDLIQNGDIIAFSTNIEGLDVVHLGFGYFVDEKLHFIHASTNGNRVRVSEKTLDQYVNEKSYIDGILVARPKEDFLSK